MDQIRAAAAEGEYAVVWPLGQRERVETVFAPRLDTLAGKTIAEVWSYMWGGDVAFSVVREELKRRYPDITIIPYTEFGNIHGPDESKAVVRLRIDRACRPLWSATEP